MVVGETEKSRIELSNHGKNIFVQLFSNVFFQNPVLSLSLGTLVEPAWTFYMFFKVASNFFNDFLNLLRKLQCVIISLLSSTFIKLLQRIIKVLAAVSSREVLRVLSCISSNFKCIWDVHNFAAISMQFYFIHNVNSKLVSSSASCLRSGG